MRLRFEREGGETQRFSPECRLGLRQKERVGSLPGGPDRGIPAPWELWGLEASRSVLMGMGPWGSHLPRLHRFCNRWFSVLPVSLLLLFHDAPPCPTPIHHGKADPSLCQEKRCINKYPILPEPFKPQHFLKAFEPSPSSSLPLASSPLLCAAPTL